MAWNLVYLEAIACLFAAICIAWFYLQRKWNYFEDIGIPYVQPSLCNIGSFRSLITEKFTFDAECKSKLGKIYGYFIFTTPKIVVHDPEILRQILIQEFKNFPNRRHFFNKSNGKMMNEGVAVATGHRWKRIRRSISPIFTASKMKLMHASINDCANHILDQMGANLDTEDEFKLSPSSTILGNYAMDVILSAVFDMPTEVKDHSYESKVSQQAKKVFNIDQASSPLAILLTFFPRLEVITSKLGLTIWDKNALKYFERFIESLMHRRQKRPDGTKNHPNLMEMMNNLKVSDHTMIDFNTTRGLTRNEILGNTMFLLIAGYENPVNTLCFMAYSLAIHPDIQMRLQEEIDQCAEPNGNISYPALFKMKYLDMCLNETLRLYPAVVRNSRVCVNDTTINGVKFKKGTLVDIPLFSLHRDPEYWINPLQFNPDRMSNMAKVCPLVFQPFGVGPRNCIAQKFVKNVIKLLMAKLLWKYSLLPTSTHKTPLDLQVKSFISPAQSIHLRARKRNKL